MKKIVSLAVVLSLFCCVNVFAKSNAETENNNEEEKRSIGLIDLDEIKEFVGE